MALIVGTMIVFGTSLCAAIIVPRWLTARDVTHAEEQLAASEQLAKAGSLERALTAVSRIAIKRLPDNMRQRITSRRTTIETMISESNEELVRRNREKLEWERVSLQRKLEDELARASSQPSKPIADTPLVLTGDWTFTWNVVKGDDLSFQVEKNPETTTVYLSKRYDGMRLVPAAAEAIAAGLAKTDEHWQRLRLAQADTRESIAAGNYTITFNQDLQYGFSVFVSQKGSIVSSSVALERADVETLVPHMAKATALASLVDARIKP